MKFDYQAAALSEVVSHINTASIPSVSGLRAYYQKTGNTEMVAKIDKARKILKIQRMMARTATLQAEVSLG